MIIEKFEKRNNWVIGYLDSGDRLRIPYEVFAKSALRSGDNINEEQLNQLAFQTGHFLAKEAAYRFLAMRHHSVKEIRTKLLKKKIDPQIIMTVTDELIESGYLDDAVFARLYAAEKHSRQKLGSVRIRAELFKKGISKEITNEVLKELEPEEEYQFALKTAQKKMREAKSRTNDRSKIKQRLFSNLISKGFDFTTARRAISEVMGSTNDEEC